MVQFIDGDGPGDTLFSVNDGQVIFTTRDGANALRVFDQVVDPERALEDKVYALGTMGGALAQVMHWTPEFIDELERSDHRDLFNVLHRLVLAWFVCNHMKLLGGDK